MFGVAVLFGKARAETFYTFIVFLIVAPVLAAIAWNHALWFYDGLPWWAQITCMILIPFLVLPGLHAVLPKGNWIHAVVESLFDALAFLIALPFRVLFRTTRLLAKERRNVRLDPFRPAVGSRPPIVEQGKRPAQKSSIFD